MKNLVTAGLGLVALIAACATQSPPPVERVEAAAAAVRKAEESNASKVPQAKLHLQLAQEQTERAKHFANQGDGDIATGLLMRAEADAELAAAIARQKSEGEEASKQQEKAETLKENIPGTPKSETETDDRGTSGTGTRPSESAPGRTGPDGTGIERTTPGMEPTRTPKENVQ